MARNCTSQACSRLCIKREGLGDIAADGQEPVIAQDHRLGIAEIADQPMLLGVVDNDALVIVVGEIGRRIAGRIG